MPFYHCGSCEEGAREEGALENAEEGALHLATHVYILALSLLLQKNAFLSPSDCSTGLKCFLST